MMMMTGLEVLAVFTKSEEYVRANCAQEILQICDGEIDSTCVCLFVCACVRARARVCVCLSIIYLSSNGSAGNTSMTIFLATHVHARPHPRQPTQTHAYNDGYI